MLQNDEIWKPVVGFEDSYQVSNLGNIKRMAYFNRNRFFGERIKNQKINEKGYRTVQFYKNGEHKFMRAHRVVMLAFIGQPKKGEMINHINGVRTDNRLCNLEYVSPRMNIIHGLKNDKLTGVYKDRKRYRAMIGLNRKLIQIGTFDTPEEASLAYLEKLQELEGKDIPYGRYAAINQFKKD